ncbi:MAG: phospholipase D-like domain-containing protein [Polyangiaceae bacterium]
MHDWFVANWVTLLALSELLVALGASGHAIVHKRDPRAAVLWVGLIWLAPFAGAALYFLLGINRIRRRAALLMRDKKSRVDRPEPPSELRRPPVDERPELSRAIDRVVRRELVAGNHIDPLENGDVAYPAMLAAGERRALRRARDVHLRRRRDGGRDSPRPSPAPMRVECGAGLGRCGWRALFVPEHRASPASRRTRGRDVPPSWSPLGAGVANLRNHRKILIADGRVAFTGGMNIRDGHVLARAPKHPVRDLHFRLHGPIVGELMECFVEDWTFSSGEVLTGDQYFPALDPQGPSLARAISDGPDEDFEVLRQVILVALSSARRRVRIVTPYFVPDASILDALVTASLRGVEVELVIPERSNIPLADWACTALLWQLLERGVKVHRSPSPFDHTKLFLVDDAWALVGSANWDARSFRLNFELSVEVHDRALCGSLHALVDARVRPARELSLAEVDGRSLPVRLRDGVAKLFAPFL